MGVKAEHGWLALGAYVAAYDYLAPRGEMLSEGVDRALEHHRVLTTAAIGYVALHLLNVLPEQIDLLHRLTTWRTLMGNEQYHSEH